MRTQCRFRTILFKPIQRETDQIELGRELAEWLCLRLPSAFQADFIDEDWGYRIVFGEQSLNEKVTLCCGSVENDQWTFFCEPYRSFTDRLFGRPLPEREMFQVLRACDELVAAESEFKDVEWFENDKKLQEFNYGASAFD